MGIAVNVDRPLQDVGKKIKFFNRIVLTEQERLIIFDTSFDELSL